MIDYIDRNIAYLCLMYASLKDVLTGTTELFIFSMIFCVWYGLKSIFGLFIAYVYTNKDEPDMDLEESSVTFVVEMLSKLWNSSYQYINGMLLVYPIVILMSAMVLVIQGEVGLMISLLIVYALMFRMTLRVKSALLIALDNTNNE